MLDRDDEQIIKEAKDAGAVLVTWDSILREAAGGPTPYEILEKASADGQGTKEAQAEVSRLRSLSPADLTALSEAGNKTAKAFQEYIVLNSVEAEVVRHLRVEEHYSWRAVSRYFSELWEAPWGANQLAGMVICQKAAKITGGDFLKPPWN